MDTRTMNHYSATYDPADNKLRLYSTSRLDAETYERVKGVGFAWAPKQGFFVAPMWTPAREDLLIELCGDIGDEDTTLVDRAEARADRFDDYSDKRAADGDRAECGVKAITSHIPFGQPILVGHHSERHARKDAEKIDNGIRRAVRMWETSEYWKQRAAGAVAHAKYKERADVRARRIKKLEADKRKQERDRAEADQVLKFWTGCAQEQDAERQAAQALRIANACWLRMPAKEGDTGTQRPTAYDVLTGSYPTLYVPRALAEVFEAARIAYPATIAHCDRWIAHYENRITYERAMLGEQGGLKAEGYDLQPGGRVLVRGEWATVIRVNRKDGRAVSVTTNCRFVSVRSLEEIQGYEPPTAEAAAAAKAVTTLAPLCNYPGERVRVITKAQWDRAPKDYKGTDRIKATEAIGTHRVRKMMGTFCKAEGDTSNSQHTYHQVYISDAKRVDPPVTTPTPDTTSATLPPPERVAPLVRVAPVASETAGKLEAARRQLRAGVQVVSAPQLFVTPVALAERMAEMADIKPGDRAGDLSAGTGRLLAAIAPFLDFEAGGELVAVEIVPALADMLRRQFPAAHVECGDFLKLADSLGPLDVILLNPPFGNAADIEHIQAAMRLLKPAGRLVAICAGGPRQHDALRPWVEARGGLWEPLPAGTFLESGTGVNSVLLAITV